MAWILNQAVEGRSTKRCYGGDNKSWALCRTQKAAAVGRGPRGQAQAAAGLRRAPWTPEPGQALGRGLRAAWGDKLFFRGDGDFFPAARIWPNAAIQDEAFPPHLPARLHHTGFAHAPSSAAHALSAGVCGGVFPPLPPRWEGNGIA